MEEWSGVKEKLPNSLEDTAQGFQFSSPVFLNANRVGSKALWLKTISTCVLLNIYLVGCFQAMNNIEQWD